MDTLISVRTILPWLGTVLASHCHHWSHTAVCLQLNKAQLLKEGGVQVKFDMQSYRTYLSSSTKFNH
jgi:hypothetical protein